MLYRLRVKASRLKSYYVYDRISVRPDKTQNNDGIVIVLHEAEYGGAPILGLKIGDELKKQGKNIHYIVLRNGPLIQEISRVSSVSVVRSIKHARLELRKAFAVGYKTAICNSVCTGALCEYGKKIGFHVVSLIHELPDLIQRMDLKRESKLMSFFSDCIVFPSNFVKQSFEARVCKVETRTIVQHQGIYTKGCSLSKEEAKKIVADEYGFSESKSLFLNVASVDERKGFDIFVDLASKDVDSIYIWVGSGDEEFYQKTCRNHGGIPRNMYMPGYVKDMEKLAVLYRAADVFTLTSREEPFGTVVLEAFLNETPVIAFEGRGGYVDVVKDGETGCLVKYDDVDGYLENMHKLIFDSNRYDNCKKNCLLVAKNSDFKKYCQIISSC